MPAAGWSRVPRSALLALLTATFTVLQGTRQLMAVLLPAGLACGADSNTTTDCIAVSAAEHGLLTGWAFTLPFCVAGFPLALLSDRHDASSVLSATVLGWAAAVAAMAASHVRPRRGAGGGGGG